MKRPRRYLPLTPINWKLNSLDLFQLDEVAARFDTLEEVALVSVYLVSCSTPLTIMFLFFFFFIEWYSEKEVKYIFDSPNLMSFRVIVNRRILVYDITW